MRRNGIGFGRHGRAAAMVVVLAGAMVGGLAGCGVDEAPSGAPVTTGAPTASGGPAATPSTGAGADPPSAAKPTAVTPGGTGGRTAGVPSLPASTRPSGTPKPPVSYDPAEDITDLVTQTTGLRLDRPVDGIRHGELVVTVHNRGPEPVWGLTFIVEVPESMTADGGDWSGCTPLRSKQSGFPAGAKCAKGYLAPGRSRTFRLGMKSPAAEDGADSLQSRWLVDVWSGGKDDAFYRDLGPDDNRRIFLVYRA